MKCYECNNEHGPAGCNRTLKKWLRQSLINLLKQKISAQTV